MSSCISGGGRAYGFDLEIVKSTSTSTITSQTSSPSSTLSESSNSPLAISTRKPRTTRKRPNQTYNEAASLLSTACPNIFSRKHLSKPFKLSKPYDNFLNDTSSMDLLLPFRVFDNSGFLIHQPIPDKRNPRNELRIENSYERACDSPVGSELGENYLEDFDAESILDEEIEEGIDSIMGKLSVENNETTSSTNEPNIGNSSFCVSNVSCGSSSCSISYGYPMGLGFGGDFGFPKAFRHVDEGEWWRFPKIDVLKMSPKINKNKAPPIEKKKKKVEKAVEVKCLVPPLAKEIPMPNDDENEKVVLTSKDENEIMKSKPRLLLKLNFDDVASAWSDRGSPFPDELSGQEGSDGGNLQARLAQIDLFSENGGMREASVLRYKEKRRNRLFSKKIRYQVRKVNADQRPRMKGRFVRRPNSP